MEKLELTHLGKIYWEKEGITKGDLIHYYRSIAPYLLPHLKDRPLVMHRFPGGISGEDFYQKEAGEHLPDFVARVKIEHKERAISYILVQNLETLLYVVNLGSIELHPFHTTRRHLHNPSYAVLDLDPEDISFDKVVETARIIHEILEEKEMKSFCKTSGARGLHIYIPVKRKNFEKTREFAREIAEEAHRRLPFITSLERKPVKRQKKVYIDFLQNNPMQTAVAVYSARAKPGATVSTPLRWSEVKKGLDPREFTIKTVPKRVKLLGDLFCDI